MNTSQLQCCIECDPLLKQHVLGVFPADRLPRTVTRYPCGFIANTDIMSREGTHWIAFYLPRRGQAEFFDSYGEDPTSNSVHFQRWFTQHVSAVKWNTKQIQSAYSSVCGLYCLFFLRRRLGAHTMQDIVSIFSSTHLTANDQFMYDYMSGVFTHCTQNECASNQLCKPLIKRI
jgi:hypothetical protein